MFDREESFFFFFCHWQKKSKKLTIKNGRPFMGPIGSINWVLVQSGDPLDQDRVGNSFLAEYFFKLFFECSYVDCMDLWLWHMYCTYYAQDSKMIGPWIGLLNFDWLMTAISFQISLYHCTSNRGLTKRHSMQSFNLIGKGIEEVDTFHLYSSYSITYWWNYMKIDMLLQTNFRQVTAVSVKNCHAHNNWLTCHGQTIWSVNNFFLVLVPACSV